MLKLLFLLNEFQSFLNFFLHFLSFASGLLLVHLPHVIFESLLKSFLLCLFLRYEIIYKLLGCSQPFFVIIMYIFHVIISAKMLARSSNRSFLKPDSSESWKGIRQIMSHLRRRSVSWSQTLIFVLKRIIWVSSALNIKRFLKNIHSSSNQHLIISNCFLLLSNNLLAQIAIIRMHKRLISISIFWDFEFYII